MVAPAFGFSASDFIAAIEVIGKVAKALRESDGASTKYRQAAIEVDNLQYVLRRVQSLQVTAENLDIVQKVQVCSLACHAPLDHFIRRIQKFESSLVYSGSCPTDKRAARWLTKTGRKLEWAFVFESECARLKSSIAPQLHTIELLLQLESLEHLRNLHADSGKTEEDVKGLLCSVNDLKKFVSEKFARQAQLTSLVPHLEALSTQQDQRNSDILRSTNTLPFSTNALESRLAALESMLQCILDNVGLTTPAALPPVSPELKLNEYSNEEATMLRRKESETGGAARMWYCLVLTIQSGVMEIMMMLLCLMPTVQRFLRSLMTISRTPTLLLQNNIHLEDALGRVLSLPYEHFRYWPVLQARLQQAFVGMPGETKVKHNQYHIMNLLAGGNLVLTRKVWDRAVFPGARLAMSMLFRGGTWAEQACPRCQVVDATSSSLKWTTCRDCDLTYRVLERRKPIRPRNSPSSIDLEDIMDGVVFISGFETDAVSTQLSAETDMAYFRRIHVVGSANDERQHKRDKDHYVTNASLKEPRTEHKKLYSVNDGTATLVSDVPANGERHHKRRESDDGEHGRYVGTLEKSVEDGDAYSYTDAASIFRDTEPRWREHRKKTRRDSLEYGDVERGSNKRSESESGLTPRRSVGGRDPMRGSNTRSDLDWARQPLNKRTNTGQFVIPPGARWTKIDRRLVSPRALEEAKERFEERLDCVVVLRILDRAEIQQLVDRTVNLHPDRASNYLTAMAVGLQLFEELGFD